MNKKSYLISLKGRSNLRGLGVRLRREYNIKTDLKERCWKWNGIFWLTMESSGLISCTPSSTKRGDFLDQHNTSRMWGTQVVQTQTDVSETTASASSGFWSDSAPIQCTEYHRNRTIKVETTGNISFAPLSKGWVLTAPSVKQKLKNGVMWGSLWPVASTSVKKCVTYRQKFI
jgi:hypothetical protein